ncbi:MAG: hypothetical protein IJB10_02680 [Clostridia bacterium]|nr:hypothetical protein [Clostridia bacterium]
MKNAVLAGMALGIMIGAVGISLCKPAQNVVKKGVDAMKEETKTIMRKNTKND